jgi:antirestriction protein ArdC
MLAFLQEKTVAQLIRDKIPYKRGWTSSKMKIYSSLNYEFEPRPKWHGMENYYHLWDSVIYNMGSKGLTFEPRQYKIDALTLEENLINGIESVCQVA